MRGEGSSVEGAQRGEALRSASTSGAGGRSGQTGLGLDHRGGICWEDLPQTQRRGTHTGDHRVDDSPGQQLGAINEKETITYYYPFGLIRTNKRYEQLDQMR